MKKADLKKMLKPIVKECIQETIHETLFESGLITQVVAEVINGVNIPQLVESMAPRVRNTPLTIPQPVDLTETQTPRPEMATVVNPDAELQARRAEHEAELKQKRKQLEERMGASFGGVNVFEGTTPVLAESDEHSPLSGQDPSDPGVNLAAIPGLKTLNFSGHIKE